MDLFCYGGKVFHPMIEHLLPLAYQLLGRIEYEQIIKTHLSHRQNWQNAIKNYNNSYNEF
jgi:hypothetical protein